MAEEIPSKGNYLKAWRKHRGLTQEALAGMVDTTGSVISLLEAGERPLSDEWLRRLGAALGTTPGTLLDHAPGETAEIIDIWDHADTDQRRTLLRVAEAVTGYRPGPREEKGRS